MPSPVERRSVFMKKDPGGSGVLSLAEADAAVVELYPQWDNKPALLRVCVQICCLSLDLHAGD